MNIIEQTEHFASKSGQPADIEQALAMKQAIQEGKK